MILEKIDSIEKLFPEKLPFDDELTALIIMAKMHGYSQSQVMKAVKVRWFSDQISEETEEVKEFRKKAEKYWNKYFEVFNRLANDLYPPRCRYLWNKTSEYMDLYMKEKLIVEICCVIFKQVKCNSVNVNNLKKDVSIALNNMFPNIKAPSLCINETFFRLILFTDYMKNDELEKYMGKFEFSSKIEKQCVKLLWCIEHMAKLKKECAK